MSLSRAAFLSQNFTLVVVLITSPTEVWVCSMPETAAAAARGQWLGERRFPFASMRSCGLEKATLMISCRTREDSKPTHSAAISLSFAT